LDKKLFFLLLGFLIMVGTVTAGDDERELVYELSPLPKIHLIKGDITKLSVKVDAIVNAAKPSLLGGGGVDGAIHKAAGPELRAYCEKEIMDVESGVRCPVGSALITPAFKIACANKIIHTVGPHGNDKNREKLLASAYCSSFVLASIHKLKSIAFPAISTGIYGYPSDDAADIVIRWLYIYFESSLGRNSILKDIYFVLDDKNFYEYKKQLDIKNEWFKGVHWIKDICKKVGLRT